jgi:uncharacterized protein YjiS (DUF1127 family)
MEEQDMTTNPLEQFATAFANLRRRRRAGRTLSALETLNDHVLRDIGIHRCQIAAFTELANDNGVADARWTA